MSEQKLGIDLVEKLIKTVVDLAEEVQADLKDGKMQLSEVIGLFDNSVDFVQLYKQRTDLLAQLKDIDSAERQQLFEYLKSEYQAPSDHAEKIVDMIIDILEKGFELYDQGIMNLLENVKDLLALIKNKPAAN